MGKNECVRVLFVSMAMKQVLMTATKRLLEKSDRYSNLVSNVWPFTRNSAALFPFFFFIFLSVSLLSLSLFSFFLNFSFCFWFFCSWFPCKKRENETKFVCAIAVCAIRVVE